MTTLLPAASRGPGTGYFGPVVATTTGPVTFVITVSPQAQAGTVTAVLMQFGRLLAQFQGEVGNVIDKNGNTVPSGCTFTFTYRITAASEYEAVLSSTTPVVVGITAN